MLFKVLLKWIIINDNFKSIYWIMALKFATLLINLVIIMSNLKWINFMQIIELQVDTSILYVYYNLIFKKILIH